MSKIKKVQNKAQQKVQGYVWRRSSTMMKEAILMAVDFWQPVALVIIGSVLLNFVLSSVVVGLQLNETSTGVIINGVYVINLLYQTLAILFLIRLFDSQANTSIRKLLGAPLWKKFIPFLILNVLVFISVLIGSLIFIIPGVLLMVWLSVAVYVMVLEDATISQSFKRSFKLIHGWGWLMFGRLLFILFLATVIAVISIVPQVGALVASVFALLLSAVMVLYIGLTYEDLVGVEKNKVLQKSSLSIWKKILFVIVAIVLFFSLALFTALGDFVQDVMANGDVSVQEEVL